MTALSITVTTSSASCNYVISLQGVYQLQATNKQYKHAQCYHFYLFLTTTKILSILTTTYSHN